MNIFNAPLSSYSELAAEYKSNTPNHILIQNMFDKDFINLLEKEFDKRLEDKNNWKDPNRGFLERQMQLEEANEFQTHEKKYRVGYNPSKNRICDRLQGNLDQFPATTSLLNELNSQDFLNFLTNLTGIEGLIADPNRRSAGFHAGFRDGYLDIHTDQTWNPYIEAFSCINVIIYLNSDWEEDWEGKLEFLDQNCEQKLFEYSCHQNNTVIWTNSENVWHGYPSPLKCPEDKVRKCFTGFYHTKNQMFNVTKKTSAFWRG
jgi:Rps23 Pro-64 3,4-dihydroxylase Tpa1-like proline 4-hydroxylase